MKKTVFSYFAIATLTLSAAFTSCDEPRSYIVPSTMTMTTTKEGEVVIFMAGYGTVNIDWGDETGIETHRLQSFTDFTDFYYDEQHLYIRNYSTDSSRTITITTTGEGITHLYCSDNQLTSLDVSNNTVLMFLNCRNNQLTNLDVSNNTTLIELICGYNQLTNLDVNKNTMLTELYCRNNQLTSLDVSKNTALTYFNCNYNQLTNLDVSKNTALTVLGCGFNQLTSLELSNNTALEILCCSNNRLTAPALNALFETLHANDEYKYIDIEGNSGAFTCNRSIATNKGWIFRHIMFKFLDKK